MHLSAPSCVSGDRLARADAAAAGRFPGGIPKTSAFPHSELSTGPFEPQTHAADVIPRRQDDWSTRIKMINCGRCTDARSSH
jgi:hypothetical protein